MFRVGLNFKIIKYLVVRFSDVILIMIYFYNIIDGI